jgi:hypothetical protein
MTTIQQLQAAMIGILEYSKSQRDLSAHPERDRWSRVATVAHKSLGSPSVADLEKMKSKALAAVAKSLE